MTVIVTVSSSTCVLADFALMSLPSPGALPLFAILRVFGPAFHWTVLLRLRCQRSVVHGSWSRVGGSRGLFRLLASGSTTIPSSEGGAGSAGVALGAGKVTIGGGGGRGGGACSCKWRWFLRPWLPADGIPRLRFCASFQLCVGGNPPRCRCPLGVVVALRRSGRWRSLLRWALLRRLLLGWALS